MRYISIYARNAYFDNETQKMFDELLTLAENKYVKKYINVNLKKFFINEWESNPNTGYVKQKEIASKDDPEWLHHAIDKGEKVYEIHIVPKYKKGLIAIVEYLNKLPPRPISIPVKELSDRITKRNSKDIPEDGIDVIFTYFNGFKWVKIYGKDSLNRESELMNHCVSDYYQQVTEKKIEIFSLRDKENIPHVTIEYIPKTKTIEQIKGHSNSTPIKYLKFINFFLKKKLVPWEKFENREIHKIGLLYQDNTLYNLSNLPSNFVIKTDLSLIGAKNFKLSDNLTINGTLYMLYSKIKELPKKLNILRDAYLSYSKISKLPKDLSIKGSLFLSDTNIDEIPNGFSIEGTLALNNSRVTSIPKNVHIGTHLILNNKITELPGDLYVGGELNLNGAKLVLPLTMKIGKIVESKTILNLKEAKQVYDIED